MTPARRPARLIPPALLLLGARSGDGLMAWNVLDPILGQNPGPEFYPVLRTMDAVVR